MDNNTYGFMSSSRVSVVPMTGSPGETMVNVYPLAVNNTHRTLVTTAGVNDGQDYQTVTIYHYGVPTAYPQGGGTSLNFVSTGETKAVTVYSPSRDFKFRFAEGQWLTDIYDSAGYVYQFDTKISKSRSTNTFYFTAAANNTTSARSGNLIFEFYDGPFDVNSASTTISVSQPAGAEAPYLSVSPATLYMDYDSAQTRSISVASNMPSWTFTNSNTTAWEASATTTSNSGEIKVTNKIHNQAQLRGEYSKINGQIDVDGVSAGTHFTGSVQVVQFYEPALQVWGSGNLFWASGGTFGMWANTPYDWWLTAPDWITFRKDGSPINPTESNKMTATTSGGMEFTGIVAENTGPERDGYIYLHFQRHDGRYDSTLGIKITQRTGEEEYITFHDQWNEDINKITFPYSAYPGDARIVIVSANTWWESSWATGGLFDLPYAETGASGGTLVQINYEGLQDPNSAVTDTLIITTRGGRNFELMVEKEKRVIDTIFVSPRDFYIPWSSQSLTFAATVTSPFPWTATTDSGHDYVYIIANSTGNSGTTTIYFNMPHNNTDNIKYGEIRFSSGGSGYLKQSTIHIFQEQYGGDDGYLKFLITDDYEGGGAIYWNYYGPQGGTGKEIYYRKNSATTWTSVRAEAKKRIMFTNPGDVIRFMGYNSAGYSGSSFGNYGAAMTTSRFMVAGNIMSMLYGDPTYFPTLYAAPMNAFNSFFRSCGNMVSAEHLLLPASALGVSCYAGMFYACLALEKAPKLPATTLADHCYDGMFGLCTSLTNAPDLPASALTPYCYYGMFAYANNVNRIKCLATDTGATLATTNWVLGVALEGTFIKDANANWGTGNNGIPNGWTVIDA